MHTNGKESSLRAVKNHIRFLIIAIKISTTNTKIIIKNELGEYEVVAFCVFKSTFYRFNINRFSLYVNTETIRFIFLLFLYLVIPRNIDNQCLFIRLNDH